MYNNITFLSSAAAIKTWCLIVLNSSVMISVMKLHVCVLEQCHTVFFLEELKKMLVGHSVFNGSANDIKF